ncbi:MAG: UvrD-helicase domain-containing protein, partial [Defluviitaleaceae bacterium]|nr:UvrD-helicase domain-containing protein [Defluviitaleaceae bacterium]
YKRAKHTKGCDEELKKKAVKLRDKAKKYITELPKEDEMETSQMEAPIRLLIEIVLIFAENFKNEKLSKNVLDFDDLEHYTIEILKNGDINFDFQEILTDEYQDSNDIQEYILSHVAGNKARRFMVGDSKQSIYAFRGTGPELFLEKYKTVNKAILSKNFRSSKEVIATVNNIFSNIMPNYDKDEMLYQGIDVEGEKTESYKVNGRESIFIANKIKELSHDYSYKDIAILVRSSGMVSEIIHELKLGGIPSFSENNIGFFENQEIKLITSILSIVDNAIQDVPLTAVLTSPLYDVSVDELLEIRKNSKELSLYESLKQVCSKGHPLHGYNDFFEDLKRWREYAKNLGIEDFLIEIIAENKLFHYAKSKSAKDNIRILLNLAKEHNGSIFSFINYLEQHTKRKISLNEAANSEGLDMVHIMTIHKSKGLEFPVVFLANMNKEFNKKDIRKDIIFHKKHGIVFKNLNRETRIKSKTMPHSVLSKIIVDEAYEEEKRVLYVALTRARERLILVAANKKKESDSYLKLLEETLKFEEIEQNESSKTIKEQLKNETTNFLKADDDRVLEIKHFMEAPYKFQHETLLPANVSISEIKRNFYNQNAKIGEVESVVESTFMNELPIPSFLTEENRASKRGTAIHLAMEKLDLSIHTQQNINEFLKSVLTEDDFNSINQKFILDFMNSNIANRLKNATYVKKETPFAMELSAEDAFLEGIQGEGILVHGIIDLYFEEADEIVLLDYKSDYIKGNIKETLKNRYKIQIDIYKKALTHITGKKVKEVIIYVFQTGEEIVID